MSTSKYLNLLVLLCLMVSCGTQNGGKRTVTPGQGKFWIDFMDALDQQNTQYLLDHSLDSIQCAECNLIPEQISEFYTSEFVFKNPVNLKKMKHLPNLKRYSYTIFKDDELIRVNYKIKANNSEGGYNLIFTFVRTKKGDLFHGMIVT